MDKNAIKKYAVWARRELISRVSQRAAYFEITEAGFGDPAADIVLGRVLSDEEKAQRQALIAQIRQKGYQQVMEEVAYTWFNRFIALRFMEVNGYLPSHVRVFTDEANQFKPQILAEAIHMELDGLDMQKVYAFKNANDDDGLFKYMVIVQCNALSAILPGMFQRISDYTELLFPDNLLREGSVLQQMIALIPEEDWKDAVQIIGWLYQYYNIEPKAEVDKKVKGSGKVSKEELPAKTQLFTPDWIVRYMVENSLGRLWLEGHPDTKTRFLPTAEEQSAYVAGSRDPEDVKWHYYLEEAEQEPEVQAQLVKIRKGHASMTPEQIKCIDPCCGSGHILAYLFDVLMQIYESYGYTIREAVSSIVQNNLYGLDIDDRAAQLTYFAVMMKARQYDRRFFNRGIQPHMYAVQESNGVDPYALEYFCNGDAKLKVAMDSIITEMHDAKEYGSILNVTPVDFAALHARFDEVWDDINMYREVTLNCLLPLVHVAEALAQKYDVVVTNPPYLSSSDMDEKLNNIVKKNYPYSKGDLFAVFIERAIRFVKRFGYASLITMQSWMFLSSYEKLRNEMVNYDVTNILHLGAHAFEELGGEVVQTVAFVSRKSHLPEYLSMCDRLVNESDTFEKEKAFLEAKRRYQSKKTSFEKIPAKPYAYWISDTVLNTFLDHDCLGNLAEIVSGMTTGNNDLYLRVWTELDFPKIAFGYTTLSDIDLGATKWIPYHKGGEQRKWYGNHEYVVNWSKSGSFNRAKTTMTHVYLKPCITWSDISGNSFAGRYCYGGFMFDVKGSCAFASTEKLKLLIGVFNSKVTPIYVEALNPTTTTQVGDLKRIPLPETNDGQLHHIYKYVDECVALSHKEWDGFEFSWDFAKHPLIRPVSTVADAFDQWKAECDDRFAQLKANEEELNRIFIDIYGLQDELTPEVADKDVTVHRIFNTKDDVPESMKGSSYVLIRRDVIVSLISYAVGCMFGRYSLDVEGLAYAGGDWNAVYRMQQEIYTVEGKEVHLADGRVLTVKPTGYNQIKTDDGWKNLSYSVDADNVIPICDDEYFDDDIVGRFVKFIETVYGSDTLEENLKFIADALGGKGTPRDVIRSYFLNDFYADHCKAYQKRPIYWLFDSGKKNGFKALIYMHRYQPDTIARIRTDYVHEQQSRYRTAIADLESHIASASTAERVKLNKQLKKLQEQDTELRTYEEKIHHLADQMISIDLDDGVKVNYAKFQDVLGKIK